MSTFGPINYLRARDLAYQAGAAQGRKGSLGAALGLWQAPTAQDPYQHEPALIAQQRAQERAQQAAGLERQEHIADEERAFGRNVVLEQLRQTGRGELQGERLAQQRDVFVEREAWLRETQAAALVAQQGEADEKRRTDEEKRRTAYAKWLHTGPGQAATKAQGREWAMALPFPFRQAAEATLDKKEYEARARQQEETRKAAETADRLERGLTLRGEREERLAREAEERGAWTEARTEEEAGAGRQRAYMRVLNDLRRETRIGGRYEGYTEEQLEDMALEQLERIEGRLGGVVR